MKIWTNGCFNVLHAGHVDYLQKAGEMGHLIVGITSDKQMRKEGKNPVSPERERAKVVLAIKGVDEVIITDKIPKLLGEIEPDIYVKGGDYNLDTMNQKERWIMEKLGKQIKFIPIVERVSTSRILGK